jgi:DNA-binding transcriptional regulator GbsR (MarR family)
MQNISQILFIQHLYGVAAKYLWVIGSHPDHVKRGHLDYFMTVDNIKEVVKSLNPEDWYKDEVCEGKKAKFSDLPTEDQWKIKEFVDDIVNTSVSQSHLVQKCEKCLSLSLEYSEKILKLLHEKNKLKKIT